MGVGPGYVVRAVAAAGRVELWVGSRRVRLSRAEAEVLVAELVAAIAEAGRA